ncbi:DUF4251 domain-containing protein [Mucilaginibacter pallidiroseus]|uniref:DUF4251 domain-containing protein n=1 Tax=Mucilaginibacter pallidiroseus TaxID=2599295 RepID=A0A563UJ26_9SPHI|nr:DUF4251 domain-containing protein [Mucilaginibacter pallidiroseus]TWR31390.1 DUF4251 domain-containing protein [Mucilaginibacter pallidiroseus]
MKRLINISLSIMLMFVLQQTTNAQTAKQTKQQKKEAEIQQLIDNQNYTFQAQYMYPQGGGQRYINNYYYDLTVSKDSVVAFLPFFGVAYFGVGYSPDDSGIKFTSTKFAYNKDAGKNRWNIVIKPQDARNINQLILNVSNNGYATLSVLSNNKQSIRYDGFITERAKTKK